MNKVKTGILEIFETLEQEVEDGQENWWEPAKNVADAMLGYFEALRDRQNRTSEALLSKDELDSLKEVAKVNRRINNKLKAAKTSALKTSLKKKPRTKLSTAKKAAPKKKVAGKTTPKKKTVTKKPATKKATVKKKSAAKRPTAKKAAAKKAPR